MRLRLNQMPYWLTRIGGELFVQKLGVSRMHQLVRFSLLIVYGTVRSNKLPDRTIKLIIDFRDCMNNNKKWVPAQPQ